MTTVAFNVATRIRSARASMSAAFTGTKSDWNSLERRDLASGRSRVVHGHDHVRRRRQYRPCQPGHLAACQSRHEAAQVAGDDHRRSRLQTVKPAGRLAGFHQHRLESTRPKPLPELRNDRRRHAPHACLYEDVRRRTLVWQLVYGFLGHEGIALHHIPRCFHDDTIGSVRDLVPALPPGRLVGLAYRIIIGAGCASDLRTQGGNGALPAG